VDTPRDRSTPLPARRQCCNGSPPPVGTPLNQSPRSPTTPSIHPQGQEPDRKALLAARSSLARGDSGTGHQPIGPRRHGATGPTSSGRSQKSVEPGNANAPGRQAQRRPLCHRALPGPFATAKAKQNVLAERRMLTQEARADRVLALSKIAHRCVLRRQGFTAMAACIADSNLAKSKLKTS
jgi:hypothetical protein